jgi:hypothetical protein
MFHCQRVNNTTIAIYRHCYPRNLRLALSSTTSTIHLHHPPSTSTIHLHLPFIPSSLPSILSLSPSSYTSSTTHPSPAHESPLRPLHIHNHQDTLPALDFTTSPFLPRQLHHIAHLLPLHPHSFIPSISTTIQTHHYEECRISSTPKFSSTYPEVPLQYCDDGNVMGGS